MPTLSTQVLVIGGGATGLGIAWDAALRGLKVILLEQGDLAQGTSGRYHGLLHSGGRYVTSDPHSARDCARENAILRRIIPAAIEDTGGLFVSTPADPPQFADRWLEACGRCNVPAQEITPAQALRREPMLNPRISRAFYVNDASLNSFHLLHALTESVRSSGCQVLLWHQVVALLIARQAVVGARVRPLAQGEEFSILADVVVNATGPWTAAVAALAGLHIPLTLGKGTLIAMASRVVNTVINRCKPPSDGDIIVPVDTVNVLGTTDVPVSSPEQRSIEPWEIDLLLAEGEILIPSLSQYRPLRAWAGIRPLYRPQEVEAINNRSITRGHIILDHAENDSLGGLISVFGGKLTTFRLMAEQTVDLICRRLGIRSPSLTAETPLQPGHRRHYSLPARLTSIESARATGHPDLLCECEVVSKGEVLTALQGGDVAELADLMRDLRLGMGPCQGTFCAYRAAAVLAEVGAGAQTPQQALHAFASERSRGLSPLAWGTTLRQMALQHRVYVDLLHAEVTD